ncbi:hypothetical protein RFI_02306 [Reticulomyxa filosa]|uniref:Uncharacterized protein n=1 Tax=Reticulomyxa filosa TaxID=46433 RepID=X6P9C8_RETFI|nr:hypothetical protein RFI_02306 [Reticulomyxa filosa]|eukprot:ETO34781.1 hypothetical protein RFI_02306 [Reticulomyxa filosa]
MSLYFSEAIIKKYYTNYDCSSTNNISYHIMKIIDLIFHFFFIFFCFNDFIIQNLNYVKVFYLQRVPFMKKKIKIINNKIHVIEFPIKPKIFKFLLMLSFAREIILNMHF